MEDVVALFKALADETRLRILKLLENGELCVCDLTAALDMTQPNISFHLGVLKSAGLIKDRRDGRWSHYDLDLGDITRRVVVITALEKVGGDKAADDAVRLATFMEQKGATGSCAPIKANL